MKDKTKKSVWGSFLIFIGLIGIIFSIFGITVTWYYRPRIHKTMITMLDSFDQIISNTNDGLVVIDSTLDVAGDNLEIITGTIDNLDVTINNISVSLESSADLIGGDLRDTIIDTQTALSSAAQSAGLIDKTLRIIDSIPLLGADYQPEVPLSASLEQVSISLDDVPESFIEIENFIRETSVGMDDLQTDVDDLSNDIQNFEKSLSDTQIILAEYQLIFEDLRTQLQDIRNGSGNFLLILSVLITGGFFLLGVAQINIFIQGKNIREGEKATINLSELLRE